MMTAIGIVVLATGARPVAIASGVLVLAFTTSAVTGIILVSVLVSKGVSEARFQYDYLSTVAHELRTPLTSMRLFTETLANQNLAEAEKNKCLSLLNQETERLADLVERVLDLSRIESGFHRFVRDPVSVDDVIQDALSVFQATALGTVEVEVNAEPNLVVSGDHTALVRALANLLTNAWKYTPPDDKQIELKAAALNKKYVVIAVADNGPGIPRDERGDLFKEFHRGGTATKGGIEGSGLGLAIVRAIVRAHRGHVELHSQPGQGAEFRIKLRRAEPA